MSRAAITTAIAAVISGVSGIENVYDYERWAVKWESLLSLFKTSGGLLQSWMVSRKATVKRQVTLGEKEIAHVFGVRGIYGLKDAAATEKTFQALVDSVGAAFDDDETLSGACDTTHPDWGPMASAVGLQVDLIDVRLFGGVLCHVADCRICALERITD